ncbi:MAG: DUF3099 domain-containing protein [Streptosporangiaceae bacterium]
MRALRRRKATVYTITDAVKPLSEDVSSRQRRYLVAMGVRTACLVLAVLLWGRIPGWMLGFLLVGAIILPYLSVVFANGGRQPQRLPRAHDLVGMSDPEGVVVVPKEPEGSALKEISGPDPEIRP